jgi:hypothetical protein
MFEYYVYSYGMHIVGLLLVAVAGCIGLTFRNWLRKWVSAETDRLDSETKAKIARTVVAFVEQVWKDLHGQDKLLKALEKARELVGKKGIAFDADEMMVLIEAAVAEFNEVFRKPVAGENAKATYRIPEVTE